MSTLIEPIELQFLLRRAGFTQAQIATAAQVHPTVVSAVIRRRARSKKVEELIAKAIGRQPESLWPKHARQKPVSREEVLRRIRAAAHAA